MSALPVIRANRVAEINSFGRSRVREAMLDMVRQRGPIILTDVQQCVLLRRLQDDARFEDRILADNRASRHETKNRELRDGEINPETGRHVIHVNSFDEMVSCVAEHFGVPLPTAGGR